MIIATIFSVTAFIAIILLCKKLSRVCFWLLLPFVVNHLWIIISNYFIERGAYMWEQDEYGIMAGSTMVYAFYASAQIMVVTLTVRIMCDHGRTAVLLKVSSLKVWVWCICAIAVCLAVLAIRFGSPVFTGGDRFSFLDSVGFIPKKVFLLHFAAGFLLGIAASAPRLRLRAVIGLMIWYVAVVLMGDKFSALFWTSLAFVSGRNATAALWRTAGLKAGTRGGWIKYYVAAIGVIAVVPVLGYLRYHNVQNKEQLVQTIVRRVAVDQGAVWHGAFRLALREGGTSNYSEIVRDDSVMQPSGVNVLMFALADYRFALASREAGISFAMGYPAIVFYVFGPVKGFLVSLVSCLYMAANAWILIDYLKRGWLFLAFAAANSWYVLQDVFLMGRTWKLLGWQLIPLFALLTISVFVNISGMKVACRTVRASQDHEL